MITFLRAPPQELLWCNRHQLDIRCGGNDCATRPTHDRHWTHDWHVPRLDAGEASKYANLCAVRATVCDFFVRQSSAATLPKIRHSLRVFPGDNTQIPRSVTSSATYDHELADERKPRPAIPMPRVWRQTGRRNRVTVSQGSVSRVWPLLVVPHADRWRCRSSRCSARQSSG